MSARLERLRALLPDLECETLLVTGPVNVRYLTGFSSSNAALIVSAVRTALLTDGRYAEAASEVEGVEPIEVDREIPRALHERPELLGPGPVGFEAEHVSFHSYELLAGGGAQLVPTRRVVERIRAIKDEDELAAIRASAALLTRVFEELTEEPVVGRTEADIAWWIEQRLRDAGAEAVSFDPIVAAGPDCALPHHHAGSRRVGVGETVLVDAGCVVNGYCSDCTRTFATGAVPDEIELAHAACLEAQEAALAAVAPGMACRDLDGIARDRLTGAGYEVLHNLGHAVGLEVHEDPRLARTSTDVLESGNVVTVEPGVYLSGLGGVRIEDLVIVTDSGRQVLTPLPKGLVRLR